MLVFAVLAPGAVFGLLALLWLGGWVPSERVISRITGVTFSACILALVTILWRLAAAGHSTGWPIAQGGAQSISNALAVTGSACCCRLDSNSC